MQDTDGSREAIGICEEWQSSQTDTPAANDLRLMVAHGKCKEANRCLQSRDLEPALENLLSARALLKQHHDPDLEGVHTAEDCRLHYTLLEGSTAAEHKRQCSSVSRSHSICSVDIQWSFDKLQVTLCMSWQHLACMLAT